MVLHNYFHQHVQHSHRNKKKYLKEDIYEEDYDLYDSEYVSWLEVNHPEAVPVDRYSLITRPNIGHDTVAILTRDSI